MNLTKNFTAKLPPGYENAQDVLENLLIIDILFTSMQISEIREIVTYGWGNFLGKGYSEFVYFS